MTVAYLYTLFDRRLRPLAIGIRTNNNTAITPLYLPGRTIYDIKQSVAKHKRWIERSLVSGNTIVTDDFKPILHGLDLPLPKNKLRVFDVHLMLPVAMPSTFDEATETINKMMGEIQKRKLQRWQHIAANASVVYESFERRGILVGGLPHYPKWSHRVFSGRSKTTGFNIQGTTKDDPISDPYGNSLDWLVNFDWRAADIRIAAILSGDELLSKISTEADPYLELAKAIGGARSECKQRLLSAINAIHIDNLILESLPGLRKWMQECKDKLNNGQAVESILGRQFYDPERPRRAFNATMQGSIVHAMQLTIRRVWELDFRLLSETHDSITIACHKDSIKHVIRTVANIMCRPFKGVLDNDPVFPVCVNIGKEWCKWKPYQLYSDVDKCCRIR